MYILVYNTDFNCCVGYKYLLLSHNMKMMKNVHNPCVIKHDNNVSV